MTRWDTSNHGAPIPPWLTATHQSGNFCSSKTALLVAMASTTQYSYTLYLNLRRPPDFLSNCSSNFLFCGHGHGDTLFSSARARVRFQRRSRMRRASIVTVVSSSANKPSSPSDVSSTAKIRSEVLSPFRSVRMFFYIAFVASGSLGGLITITQLIGALGNPSRAPEVPEILKDLAIDIGAVSLFAFLYYRENKAKTAQLSRLSREESLSNLKLRVDGKKTIPVSTLRGIARLVICAGPASFITESFNRSEPFTEGLLERGVLVVPLVTDGNSPTLKFEESEEQKLVTAKRKRLWQLAPVCISEWFEWLDEQKKLAGVSSDSPVYLSLRLDGRVRGSGVGYPPWNALIAQLPPAKGMWSGLLDGMDGRVL